MSVNIRIHAFTYMYNKYAIINYANTYMYNDMQCKNILHILLYVIYLYIIKLLYLNLKLIKIYVSFLTIIRVTFLFKYRNKELQDKTKSYKKISVNN